MLTDAQLSLEYGRRDKVAGVAGRLLAILPERVAIAPSHAGRHPLVAVLYGAAARGGPSARHVIEEIARLLATRQQHDEARMLSGRLLAIQSQFVLPERETRNALLSPASVEEADLESSLDAHVAAVRDRMPDWWQDFASIVASYTVVEVNNTTAPRRFSGTFSEAAGAMHGAHPDNAELFAETLTHEAGHLWLNLLIDHDRTFIGNAYDNQTYLSPWRNDARPLHGIFHGMYVFSFVIPVLLALDTVTARSRAGQLIAEAEDAIQQVVAFGILSNAAADVVAAARSRIEALVPRLSDEELATQRQRYAAAKATKVTALRIQHPHFMFV